MLGRPLPAVPWGAGSSAPSPSCSGTVAVLAGLVALRSAQTHDPSWDPQPHFGVTAGASRLSLAAQRAWVTCNSGRQLWWGLAQRPPLFFFGAAARRSPLQPAHQKIYLRPGLYHLSFCLCNLPPPRGYRRGGKLTHARTSASLVTVAKSGTPDDGAIGQPTGRSPGTRPRPPLTNLPFRNNASRSPLTSQSATSAVGLLHLIWASTEPLPCLYVWRSMPASEPEGTMANGSAKIEFCPFCPFSMSPACH